MTAVTAARPWHRHVWPWIIIGILTCSVALTLAMVTIAVTHPDNLVTDNYYEAGKGINRSLDRELLGQSLNLQARVGLVLNLISPTQPNKDRKVVLARNPSQPGRYVGQLRDRVEGRRFVELLGVENAKTWRLFEEERIVAGQPLTLGDEPIQGAGRH
jgi:hypothetical protein